MRVARVLLASASRFDSKCFGLDRDPSPDAMEGAWSLRSEPGDPPAEACTPGELARALRRFAPDLLHVYGSGIVPHQVIAAAAAPWLADRRLGISRSLFGRRPRAQSRVLLDLLAEPVPDDYFTAYARPAPAARPTVGSLRQSARSASVRELVDARIRRFRDDVNWVLHDTPPAISRMRTFDLWVDLADDENDLDGLVGEAIALGLPVVATRTAANLRRTADGKAAALCPKGDHNEMAHAIVTMLFKPERSAPILEAAAALREQFRPAKRREALRVAYAEVLR